MNSHQSQVVCLVCSLLTGKQSKLFTSDIAHIVLDLLKVNVNILETFKDHEFADLSRYQQIHIRLIIFRGSCIS